MFNSNINKDNTNNLEFAVDKNIRQLKFIVGLLKGTVEKQFILSNEDFKNALNSAEYDFRKQKRYINKTINSIINTENRSERLAQKKFFGTYVKEFMELYNSMIETLVTIYEVPNRYWSKINTLYHLIPEETRKLWYKKLSINTDA